MKRKQRKKTPAVDRFWAMVNKTESCWNWTGSLNPNGRGQFNVISGTVVLAPRYSWEISKGKLGKNDFIKQSCENALCVNPEHLLVSDRAARPGTPVETRFWPKVQKTKNCWLWTGGKSVGYGHMNVRRGETIRSHRLSWIIHNGPVPGNLFVCHKCNNKLCVNPDHLYLATSEENISDAYRDGLYAVGEKHGMRKITDNDVVKIRELRAKGVYLTTIAKKFGISQSHVSAICLGKYRAK